MYNPFDIKRFIHPRSSGLISYLSFTDAAAAQANEERRAAFDKNDPMYKVYTMIGFPDPSEGAGIPGDGLDNFGPGGVDPRTIIDPRLKQPQQPITKNPNIEAGYYDSPEYKEYRDFSGPSNMAVGYDPYFGMSGSSTNMGGGYYEDYLNRTGKTSYLQGGTNYVEDPEYTENQKMQQPYYAGGLFPETGDGRLPEFNTPVTPPQQDPPAIPNLSEGLGAQLRQLFQQYMSGGQRNQNNYSQPMQRPGQQYRTAVTDTDEYKAYNDYASGLGPTEDQRTELQRLQSAFEGTDAYSQFDQNRQQRQQRQSYMQPLGYNGGYGGGYGGRGIGGFGGYGGGYGGYQQPYQQPYQQSYQQPYQQPYYGGGVMGGSSYQQPYRMAQQYQQQSYQQQQPYGSVQAQYPSQYPTISSPFANSIR